MLRWPKQRDNDGYKYHLDELEWTTTSLYTAHTAYAVYIASYTACLNTVDIVYTADILLKQCVFSYISILL